MQPISTFFLQKKTLFVEIIILVMFLFGLYYVYTLFSEPTLTTTTNTSTNQDLLGENYVLFIKAVNQDSLSFKDVSFINSDFVKQLQDFSVKIDPSYIHGRLDPFTPYASTRPIR